MRFAVGAVLVLGALMLMGRNAEAQARGTLQATTTVVDTRQGFEAISAVRQVVANSRVASQRDVATVAQISTDRPVSKPSTIIVTVDFSRN